MKSKLAVKVGLLFFVFLLIIELLLYFALYTSLASERIDEVVDNLLDRGNTHRDVLEANFEEATLAHVGMMESASEFIVVITDEKGNVVVHSDPLEPAILEVIEHTDKTVPAEGEVVEKNWQEAEYIATDSPITIDELHKGHVFMFVDAEIIKRAIQHLSDQFLLVGVITIVLTVITIAVLSKLITLPLIKMKEATKQLSMGNSKVELNTGRNDELGELAISIADLSADLDRLRRERNEFLASIAHELRTPLTYIKGYADILRRPEITEAEKREYTKIIQEESEQLTALIKDLFELAKMDQNKFVIDRKEVALDKLIDSVADLVRPAFSEDGIRLTVSSDRELSAIVDPERLQQVLLNILDNARKHSTVGEQVAIKTVRRAENIVIVIKDEGEGIPPEELPYIFDRLYRVEKSRSRSSGGKGLGLAIAKEIIDSHGGLIAVNSELGRGTEVTITLKEGKQDEKSAVNR